MSSSLDTIVAKAVAIAFHRLAARHGTISSRLFIEYDKGEYRHQNRDFYSSLSFREDAGTGCAVN